MNTVLFPMETLSTNTPPVYRTMETLSGTVPEKTVFSKTLFTKNSVVSYLINPIYTLLSVGEKRKLRNKSGYSLFQVSIPGKGPRGYEP
jgi:hypothetical protein